MHITKLLFILFILSSAANADAIISIDNIICNREAYNCPSYRGKYIAATGISLAPFVAAGVVSVATASVPYVAAGIINYESSVVGAGAFIAENPARVESYISNSLSVVNNVFFEGKGSPPSGESNLVDSVKTTFDVFNSFIQDNQTTNEIEN